MSAVSSTGRYMLLITDRNLRILGDPVANWTSLDVTLRFNEPGSGLFTAPGYPGLREQLDYGARIVVMRYPTVGAGQFIMAGPYEGYLYERSDDGENAGAGMVTINFSDDLAEIVARQVYPNPAVTPEAQDTDTWSYTGNAETALRNLADLNAGPGALAARRMPRLVLGDVAGIVAGVTGAAQRMEPLGDVARRIAVAAGEIGFRTVQRDDQILFEVYQPADKSTSVRFGFGLGNVKYLGYYVTAPTANAAIVGGQGEGSDRFVLERTDPASIAVWGRREILVSRPGNSATAALQADGDEALADGAMTTRLASNVADGENQRFGTDYGVGDRVAIESWPGEQLVDIVRTVHIQAWPTAGDVISATVGSQAASSDPAYIKRLRQIDERVGRLERTVVPAVVP